MVIATNEKWKTDFGYWSGPCPKDTKYILSDGTEYASKLSKTSPRVIKHSQAMIEGEQFINVAKLYFSFLETEFGMKVIEEKESGNAFYGVQFGDKNKVVSISYENIEDYLQVIVFLLENEHMPDYDNKAKTLHLNYLNSIVMTKLGKNERSSNAQYFSKYRAESKLERKLLKEAMELRICLKYGPF